MSPNDVRQIVIEGNGMEWNEKIEGESFGFVRYIYLLYIFVIRWNIGGNKCDSHDQCN